MGPATVEYGGGLPSSGEEGRPSQREEARVKPLHRRYRGLVVSHTVPVLGVQQQARGLHRPRSCAGRARRTKRCVRLSLSARL